MWQRKLNILFREIFFVRVKILNYISFFLIFLFLIKSFYLQIIKGKYFLAASENNRLSILYVPALRGKIFLKDKVIASNKLTYSLVWVNPSDKGYPQWLDNLSGITGIKEKVFIKNIKLSRQKGYPLLYLLRRMDRKKVIFIDERIDEFPGLKIMPEPVRIYPFKEEYSHITGYLGEVSKKELKKYSSFYKSGMLVGKAGLEKKYEKFLRGKTGGSIVELDAFGRIVKVVKDIIPEEGCSLYLNIDPDLQDIAYKMLKGRNGVIIGLEPDTGKVLLFVSNPGYDPEIFPYNREEISKILKNKNHPLLNRTIQAKYSPGSIFKIVVSVAGLQEDRFKLNDVVKCKGKFVLNKIEFDCWKKKGHGKVSFFDGFKNSCNVYFYNIGLKVGAQLIYKYATFMGLTLKSNIDLPEELTGFIPSPFWKKKNKRYPWLPGDTVNMSIGQGWIMITPMEVALFIEGVANKGEIYQPRIVSRIVDSSGKVVKDFDRELLYSYEIKKEVWDLIYKAMSLVIKEGTARWCNIKEIELFGKTGTAQNPFGKPHSWFISFNKGVKRMALVVFVENGGMGGKTAVPIARSIWIKFRDKYL